MEKGPGGSPPPSQKGDASSTCLAPRRKMRLNHPPLLIGQISAQAAPLPVHECGAGRATKSSYTLVDREAAGWPVSARLSSLPAALRGSSETIWISRGTL